MIPFGKRCEKLSFIVILVIVIILVVLFFSRHGCGECSLAGCRSDAECETPFEYLALSHCPYSSACIDGACEVICPVWTQYPEEQAALV
jgi:hypothetical protein